MRTSSRPGPDALRCLSCGKVLASGEATCPLCAETLSPDHSATPSAPHAGPKQIGDYAILREIGSGGMGTVFEAVDQKMRRRVALKVLSRHHSSTERAEQRFAREAWIGGKLTHPNLVKVYGRGEWEELSYYSMELVDGGSLHDVVRAMRQWGRHERLGLELGSSQYVAWAIGRVIAAARGLDYAHRGGVIHRDIKPMNILLDGRTGDVKIADFGLALDAEATRLTTAGKMFGTVAYMAPEQIRGDLRAIDARSDIYALGVTLFELLTLELPFAGNTQQMYMNAVLTQEARRPSKLNEKVGRDLEIVLRKALEKDPKDRYATAGQLADDLENVLGFRPIAARPLSAISRGLKWVRRKPVHAALAAALVLGLPVVGALTLRNLQSRRALQHVEIEEQWEEAVRLDREDRYVELLGPLGRILQIDGTQARALRARAIAYSHLARKERDPARRSELEQLALADIATIAGVIPDSAWPYSLRAHLLDGFGREAEARPDREMAIRLRSPSPSDEEVEIDAILALKAGDHARAAGLFTQFLVGRPNNVVAILYRAKAYQAMRESTKAIEDLRLAAALRPNDPYTHEQLGRALTRAGDPQAGEGHLRHALAISSENPSHHVNLSDNLLEQGRRAFGSGDTAGAKALFEKAEAEARRAVELDPALDWAHLNLGASLMEQNRTRETPDPALTREAIERYGTVVSLWRASDQDPRSSVYRRALGNLCDAQIQIRDLSRALEACRGIAELDPKNPVNFYNLAGAHALLGQKREALAALEKDVELGDTDHEYLAADAWFASLRGDSRFAALLARMKAAAPESK